MFYTVVPLVGNLDPRMAMQRVELLTGAGLGQSVPPLGRTGVWPLSSWSLYLRAAVALAL